MKRFLNLIIRLGDKWGFLIVEDCGLIWLIGSGRGPKSLCFKKRCLGDSRWFWWSTWFGPHYKVKLLSMAGKDLYTLVFLAHLFCCLLVHISASAYPSALLPTHMYTHSHRHIHSHTKKFTDTPTHTDPLTHKHSLIQTQTYTKPNTQCCCFPLCLCTLYRIESIPLLRTYFPSINPTVMGLCVTWRGYRI